jgi:hypothetical protein
MSIEKDNATAADAAPATAAFDALLAGAEAAAANAAPPKVEAPKIDAPFAAAPQWGDAPAQTDHGHGPTTLEPAAGATKEHPRSGAFGHLPLAASIVFAASFGTLAGAAAVHLARDAVPQAMDARMAETTQTLNERMAQLGADITILKTTVAVIQRNTGLQSGKLADRLDRIEKGQAEPAAKLAKLVETVDRLEHRSVAAAQQSGDITGSVTASKPETKPHYAEGWWLRDYYAGRAVVENQNGRFFEVGPGSNLPGLGRVDSIKREDGRVVVVTRNGLIAASMESRRAPYRY